MFSTLGDIQYIGGYHEFIGGYHEYIELFRTSGDIMMRVGDIMMRVGDIMSTSGDSQYIGGYHEYIRGISRVHQGMFSTSRDIMIHVGEKVGENPNVLDIPQCTKHPPMYS